MRKRNLRRVFKHKNLWGNSVLSINLKFWKCVYCGVLLKDDKPFAIVKLDGNMNADVFCSEFCLSTHIMKIEAIRIE